MTDLTPQDYAENKTFCSMAWNHQFMDPTGRVKPCCRFEERHRPAENDLNKTSLEKIFHGSWMNEVRAKMLAGEAVSGCKRCYQEEAAGKKSLRQRYNQNQMLPIQDLVEIETPRIRWIELAISNMCNLACRMCDSRYSRVWYDEEIESFGSTHSQNKTTKMDIAEIFPFLKDIVHMKFTGGEPLITQEHWQLIERLMQERDCRDIFLNYSTNCTIFPKPAWTDLWDQFHSVEFAMSFDSASPNEAEYIRWPAKFEKIESTTQEFFRLANEKKNYSLILRTTVSLLNVWSLPETILWWQKNNPNKKSRINPTHLTHPSILSMTVLPQAIKDRIEKKFQPYLSGETNQDLQAALQYTIKYMNSQDDSHLLPELKTYLQKTDSFRKQDFFSSYPYFSDLFDFASMPNNDRELPQI